MTTERKTVPEKGKRNSRKRKKSTADSARAGRPARRGKKKRDSKTPTKAKKGKTAEEARDNKTPTTPADNKTPTEPATNGSPASTGADASNKTPTVSSNRELSAREAAARLRRTASEADAKPAKDTSAPTTRSTSPIRAPQPPTDIDIPPFWLRHDLVVLIASLAVLATGALLSQSMSAPPRTATTELGLSLDRPTALLALPEPAPVESGDGSSPPLPLAKTWVSLSEPSTQLTLLIDNRPTYNNLRGALAIARAGEYGEMLWVEHADEVRIRGRDWLRTRYRYAHKPTKTDAPRLATAVELASLSGGLLYVVTAHGSAETVDQLYRLVAPSLTVDSNNGAANSALRSPVTTSSP